jgi:hypothetical protein
METARPDNIFPLTKEQILANYEHVFKNPFQSRTIESGSVWNLWTNHTHHDWFGNGYTKGHSTSAILINKEGEKDYVEFWQFYKNSRISYGYSFKKRELFKEILN